MSARIRRATVEDIPSFLEIKAALPLESSQDGGFLLGTSAEHYAAMVTAGSGWVLELGDRPVGFAITFPDPVLRASDLWQRRQEIRWVEGFSMAAAERDTIGYFEQLAVRPEPEARRHAAALALRSSLEQFRELGTARLFTTTVVEPVVNRAALPFLVRVGAREIGRIEEHYAGVGRVLSAVHEVRREPFERRMAATLARGHAETIRTFELAGWHAPPV